MRLMLSEKGECEIDQSEVNTKVKVIYEGRPLMAGGIWKEGVHRVRTVSQHCELRAKNN